MESQTRRKPYIRPVKASWWTSRKEYILYMIREATALFNLWIGIEITAIAAIAAFCETPQICIENLLSNPAVIVLNIIALLATCFHTFTWYKIFPKGVRIFTSKDPANTQLIPPAVLSGSLYFITAVASVLIILALTLA